MVSSLNNQTSWGEIINGSDPASWPLTSPPQTLAASLGVIVLIYTSVLSPHHHHHPLHLPQQHHQEHQVSWPHVRVLCVFLLRDWCVYCCNVCTSWCSVSEHNKYPATDTEKLEQGPRPTLTVSANIHQKWQEKQYLFFQGKFSACWCSDEYRLGKQILIDCKARPGQARHWSSRGPTCINCILIQSRCKAFSAGKLIVIPFSFNTIQLTRQTLFMSSLHTHRAFFIGE